MIDSIIKKIPQDKVKHILAGIIIGYPLQVIGLVLDILLNVNFCFLLASLIALIIVLGKEIIYDLIMKKGNCEFWDFVASAIPIVQNLIIYYLSHV